MSLASADAILQAAAKALVWELYAVAGYARTRSFVNVEKFDRALRSAAREWRAARENLKGKRRSHGNART